MLTQQLLIGLEKKMDGLKIALVERTWSVYFHEKNITKTFKLSVPPNISILFTMEEIQNFGMR